MQPQATHEAPRQDKKSKLTLDMEKWSGIIQQWDKTKESQQAYCQRLNLNSHTFSYVQAKLKRKNKPANKFIPVQLQAHPFITSQPTTHAHASLVVENTNGLKLHIPLAMNEGMLFNVFKLIGWHHA